MALIISNLRVCAFAASGIVLRREVAIFMLTACLCCSVAAQEAGGGRQEFDTRFLRGSAGNVDLTQLMKEKGVLPGNYPVDVYVNGQLIARQEITFRAIGPSEEVSPCLTRDLVEKLGLDMGKTPELAGLITDDTSECIDVVNLISGAGVRFDSERLRLLISLPQAVMARGKRGYVSPALWDDGVSAAFVNYQYSANRYNRSSQKGAVSNSIILRSGVNISGWRFRNDSNYVSGVSGGRGFVNERSYAQHALPVIQGQLVVGDSYADADLFDSVRFRGVKVSSDEGMFADSERGYAPVVRGIADTNATVEVRQNGFLLSSTQVSPGAFVIDDIFPSGSNGDLEVTVIEANGQRKVSRQPFSSLPLMVREGRLRYSVAAGTVMQRSRASGSPRFVSASAIYGLSSNLTGAIGAQLSNGYGNLVVGVGRNTTLGAFSLDLSHSRSSTPAGTFSGNSVRALYGKTFAQTDTTFTLAAYRYSTKGFRTLNDYAAEMTEQSQGEISGRIKNRLDLTVNQSLGGGDFGYIYLNGSQQNYWDKSSSRSFSLGFNDNWRDINYSLGVTRTQWISLREYASNDTLFSLSLSMPLGSASRSPRVSINNTSGQDGNSSQLGLFGYLDEGGTTSYSVQGSRESDSRSNAFSAAVSSRTSFADAGFAYGKGQGYDSQSLSVAGAFVAHAGGITPSGPLGETFGLVEIPDGDGVRIGGYQNVVVGGNGYGVVPTLTPYRTNWVNVQTSELDNGVSIEEVRNQLIPTRGAIPVASFKVARGQFVSFELRDSHDKKLPFGTAVESVEGKQLAISDPSGRALAFVEKPADILALKWEGQSCRAAYSLPERAEQVNYERAILKCAS